MILLNNLQSLQIVLAGAVATAQPHFYAGYVDLASGALTTPAPVTGTTNGTTAVTWVSAPAASTTRQVKALSLYNADSAVVTVTVRINDNGTNRTLRVVALSPGETLEYADGIGFKVSTVPSKSYIYAQRTTTNQTFSAATFTTVIFNTETADTKGEYNPATGEFTVQASGRYLISGYVHLAGYADGTNVAVAVFRNGAEFMRLSEQAGSNPSSLTGQASQCGSTTIATLAQGDVITIRAYIGAAAPSATLYITGVPALTYMSVLGVQ